MPDSNLPMPLLLFLSHAGVDTEAARRLKQRLEAAPEAREHGLRVWFDKDDLRAGEPWQAQLEEAIRHRSAAFAVYVGSRGVVNWVDAEIQLALGRAVTDPTYRFIPQSSPHKPPAPRRSPALLPSTKAWPTSRAGPTSSRSSSLPSSGGTPPVPRRLRPSPSSASRPSMRTALTCS